MRKVKIYLSLCFICLNGIIHANKISKAFDALKIYNYFEAKQLFEKSLKKEPACASYGLSIIYYRNDNPFFNIDSAYKYIIKSEDVFSKLDIATIAKYKTFNVTGKSIDSLKELIHSKAFEIYKSKNKIETLNSFIEKYSTAPQSTKAIELRDSMVFEQIKKDDTYSAYKSFIEKYPSAKQVKEAKDRYEATLFQASTQNNTIEEFALFISKYPSSPYLDEAQNAIYALSTSRGTIE